MDKPTKKEVKALRHAERVEMEAQEARKKKMKDYGFWIGFVVLLALSIGVIFFLSRPKTTQTVEVSSQVNSLLPAVTATDYVSGPENAKVTIIEYGDFQCPACAHYFPMVQQLKKEFGTSVRFVFRNFPLPTVHQNALLAAQAAYAAGKQGKFWEMHDLLFQNQEKWSASTSADELFAQYAVQLNLNPMQFTTDMMSTEASSFVSGQSVAGQKAGVQGTPTFFLNGKLLTNPTDYEQFKATIQQELR